MNRYQINEIRDRGKTAGAKAVEDVIAIANTLNFKELDFELMTNNNIFGKVRRNVPVWSEAWSKKEWNKIYSKIEENATVLFQSPWYDYNAPKAKYDFFKKLKAEKNAKFIFVIHDVNELRPNPSKYDIAEFNLVLEFGDRIIVHNTIMRDYMIKRGVDKEKLVVLQIFDYLVDNKEIENASFSRSVTIAGNLDVEKTAYLGKLGKVKSKFVLYGPNFTQESSSNLDYRGLIPSNEIPEKLHEGFGLIWDGPSIDTCAGMGAYLRYNNPHKLSLYIASGLPVVIWDQAAEATFVKENGLGLTISSLYDLPKALENVTEEDYDVMATKAREIGVKLRSGNYMSTALRKSLSGLE
ncbi:glycosyl transferase [Lactobacillus delbrueckii]|uniref:glycosyl transferase n=1 Tax=Lactobacillus delbrueckii TaxID=1584 RepID=UPI001E3C054F|nr:glycosyl transferase [Lactobacillus delbrueckii]MCD5452082.1 glycosyl transferase [Lactobacillus delbrueckii subsp. lactis]